VFPSALTLADINGDGWADVVVGCSNASANDLGVLRGLGNGAFLAPVNFSIGMTVTSVVAKDFDGDSRIDVAASVRSQGKVYVLSNNSTGNGVSFSGNVSSYSVGAEPVALLLADLNRDNRQDLIAASYRANEVAVFNAGGNGSSFLTPPKVATVGTGPYALTAGELTGDSNTDVVAANFDNNTLSVLRGQGDGSFASVSTLQTIGNPSSIALADMDQDGKLDIVVANSGRNQITVLLGRGDGTFEQTQRFFVGEQPLAMVVTDLDGDNKPDIATANFTGGDVSILLNKTAP